jgi:hypothetical protein
MFLHIPKRFWKTDASKANRLDKEPGNFFLKNSYRVFKFTCTYQVDIIMRAVHLEYVWE